MQGHGVYMTSHDSQVGWVHLTLQSIMINMMPFSLTSIRYITPLPKEIYLISIILWCFFGSWGINDWIWLLSKSKITTSQDITGQVVTFQHGVPGSFNDSLSRSFIILKINFLHVWYLDVDTKQGLLQKMFHSHDVVLHDLLIGIIYPNDEGRFNTFISQVFYSRTVHVMLNHNVTNLFWCNGYR